MSLQSIPGIMSRIKTANPGREIAVFKPKYLIGKKNKPLLQALIVQTVETGNKLKLNDDDFIGCFDNTMNRKKIRSILEAAALDRLEFMQSKIA